ncbi:putative cyclase-domain-containing protein [Dioszegia hungarica]|uniref:Cyclase-domain-containing protein n=1 Tax=Dioszegia hungarica TaxID=4972 RepID=A0AA38LYA0_9TREE|nr:putative cyclase-domain-containing protein [Dioszegia hungarica]KAI9638641.1 putative cyclase-domain-containing protein [Dioszegia hungarica]
MAGCGFDDLPLTRPGPPLNAWGLYGEGDEYGRLNLITAQTVQAGLREAKEGITINLNLPLDTMPLNPTRAPLRHEIIHRTHCNDDHVSFNTQGSTQWDGFRHYPYLNYPEKQQYIYYGGMTSDEARDRSNHRCGIQNYAKKPISGRAHLLDIASFLERHQRSPLSYFDASTPIDLETLESCAAESRVVFKPGDILIVRTGWTEAFFGISEEERQSLPHRQKRGSCGVSSDPEVLRWHWENGIAAVASDAVAYEAYPSVNSPSIHETFLAGWGMPIGELFDLRELAAECKRLKRWTFFFTSMPLYVNGGIASPPNAQAVL